MDAAAYPDALLSSVPPPPPWLLPCFFGYIVTVLSLPSRIGKPVAIVGFALVVKVALRSSLGVFAQDYPYFCIINGHIPLLLAFVLFGDPEHLLWKRAQGPPTSPRSLGTRLSWNFQVWTNPRGVGCSYEARHLRYRSETKGRFLLRQTIRVITSFLLIDVVQSTTRYLQIRGYFDSKAFFDAPAYLRIPLCFASMMAGYAGLQMTACSYSLVSLTLGFSQPSDWPDLFGDFSRCTSIHTLWRHTWHQQLQPPLRRLARLLARHVFGLQPRTWPDLVVHLCTGFFCSGVLHALASFLASRHGRARALAPLVWRSELLFFCLQPLGILTESVVGWAAQRYWGVSKDGWLAGWVGRVWVVAWLAWTLPFMVGNHAIAGLWEGDPVGGPFAQVLLAPKP